MPGEYILTLVESDSARPATEPTAALDLLRREIANPATQWSLGTFGAIAEFSRDRSEPVGLTESAASVTAVTARGGITLQPFAQARLFASESITKSGWNQRIALCLPLADSAMNRRTVLTEIGPDRQALRPEDRESILFDLGLGAPQADFCVRIVDRNLVARLRAHAGRAVFESGNPAMGAILEVNPHRVFVSRLGRVEVYQPIPPPSGKSPDGPHTHVLPKLLKSGRTHPATEPIPAGWVPCAHLYPAHPARDGIGLPRPFDASCHDAFQDLIERFGDAETQAAKQRVIRAVNAGEAPAAIAPGRRGRTSIRIALRQMKAAGNAAPSLQHWIENFDPAGLDEAADDAAFHHDC